MNAPSPAPVPAALARRRFLRLQGLRFAGLVLTLVGLIGHAGWIAGAPPPVGTAMIVVGNTVTFLLPALLARAWKRESGAP